MMGPSQIVVLLAIGAMNESLKTVRDTHEFGVSDYIREKTGQQIFISQLRQALRKLRSKNFIEHDGTSLNHESGKFRKLNKVTPEGKAMIASLNDVTRGMFHEAD
jgi:DNA-binding PadR family transcriptional regulator